MRNLICCLSGIALLLVSCAGNDRNPDATVANPQVPASKTANPDLFSNQPPMVPGVNNLPRPVETVPGLTPPTNPDQRANLAAEKIAAGREDPFAPVPGLANNQPNASATAPSTVAVLPQAYSPNNSSTIVVSPLSVPPPPPILNNQLPLVGVPPTTQPISPVATRLPSLPPQTTVAPVQAPAQIAPPEPVSLARSVKVTGVVQVKGKLSAIVQVPEEPSPRSVQAGEYLANGTIRVKQIRMTPNQEPVVVLEENGQTVTRTVGG